MAAAAATRASRIVRIAKSKSSARRSGWKINHQDTKAPRIAFTNFVSLCLCVFVVYEFLAFAQLRQVRRRVQHGAGRGVARSHAAFAKTRTAFLRLDETGGDVRLFPKNFRGGTRHAFASAHPPSDRWRHRAARGGLDLQCRFSARSRMAFAQSRGKLSSHPRLAAAGVCGIKSGNRTRAVPPESGKRKAESKNSKRVFHWL